MNLFKDYKGFNVEEFKDLNVVLVNDSQKEKEEYFLIEEVKVMTILLTDKDGNRFTRNAEDFVGDKPRFTMKIIA